VILGFTGHRRLAHPEKSLGRALAAKLIMLGPKKVISGMALGFDQLAARVCVYIDLPFIAAIPAKEQPNRWPNAAVKTYYKILERAAAIVYVDQEKKYADKGDTFVDKLFKRNKWIVNNSTMILAYYLNTLTGGTVAAMRFAIKQQKSVLIFPPIGESWQNHS